MFEFITNTEERGQVGIGTLIVFIAMVLVAAIAAGVLINTAGFLQTQAEATGEDSTDLVSERINVNSAAGIVESASDGILEQVRLTVSGAPGADDIDLSDTTIQGVGPGGQQNLVFASGAVADNSVTVPDGTNNTDVPTEVNEYTTSVDVGVSELGTDDIYTLNVTDGSGNTVNKAIDAGAGDDDQVVSVDVTGIDVSGSNTLTFQLEGPNATVVSGPTTADVVSTADNTVNDPSGLSTDTIDAPNEIDEDATSITIAVGSTTDGDTLNVSDGNGNFNNTANISGAPANITVELDGDGIDPATVDQLEVTLEDSTDGNAVLDSETVQTVDSVQTVGDLRADEFAVEDNGNFMPSAVLGGQDQYTIVLNPKVGALQNTENVNDAFGQSDSATLDLVSPAGAATQVEIRAPDLFNEDGEAVRL